MPLKNTIKPTIRSLIRDKSYLVVNVLSLSVGLTCCLFVFTYILDELNYDRFHEDAERIFRVEYEFVTEDGQWNRFANLHGHVVPDWLSSITEIELKTRFARHANLQTEVNGELFDEGNILAAEHTFFKLFSFELLDGNPESALTAPNSIVIDKSTAQKYFNTANATGEVLILRFRNKEVVLTVTGVMENVPPNSHFSFGMVTSSGVFEDLYGFSLDEIQQAYSYIRLAEGIPVDQMEARMNEIHSQHDPESVVSYSLQPLTDIRLYSSSHGELAPNSNVTILYVLSVIALIILAVAFANFTTLATARSVKRAGEIGMRKVFGAGKGNLISACFLEGVLLAFFALVLTLCFALQFLPQFNHLAGKAITASQLMEPSLLFPMILTAILTGCMAGFYPAFALINQKPVSLLFGRSTNGLKEGTFWKSVIVVQIATTIVLILASYLVHKQVDFIQNKDMGFDKERIITLPNYLTESPETFMNRLNQHPAIEHVTVSSYIPGVSKSSGFTMITVEGRTDTLTFDWISADHHYLDTYGINLKEGRNFSPDHPTDTSQAFIINETAAARLGWSEPLGKRIEAFGREGQVVGVVEDFNLLSLHSSVSPLLMMIDERFHWTISAKINAEGQFSETIAYTQTIWQEMVPGTPFTYEFVDDRIAAVYETEQRTRSLFMVFSVLALVIAMLGLFSFSSYTMQQKTREIGIRKVLGATVYDILRLFYTGYARLLIIAACIALPAGFIWMRAWLQNFSYRTEIGPDVFAVPLILALVILLASVSWQAVKGAGRNPVDSIRVE